MYQPDALPRRPFLGVELCARRYADEARRGLEVVRVTPEGAAAKVGIRPGVWIELVNHRDCHEMADARELVSYVRTLAIGAPLEFVVTRDGDKLELHGETVPLPLEQIAYANVHLAHVTMS